MTKIIFLLVSVGLAINANASIRDGEMRRIDRESADSFDSRQCRNKDFLAKQAIRLKKESLDSANQRLEKFDRECAKDGGKAKETDVRQGATQRSPDDGEGGDCVMDAWSVVIHRCSF